MSRNVFCKTAESDKGEDACLARRFLSRAQGFFVGRLYVLQRIEASAWFQFKVHVAGHAIVCGTFLRPFGRAEKTPQLPLRGLAKSCAASFLPFPLLANSQLRLALLLFLVALV